MKNYKRPNRYGSHKNKMKVCGGFFNLPKRTPPSRTSELWSPKEDGKLLSRIYTSPTLYVRLSADKNNSLLVKEFHRSYDSIDSRIRKLAIRYKQEDAIGYQPCDYDGTGMLDRSGTRWNGIDRRLIKLALGKAGRKNGANCAEWIARLTGRTVEEITERINFA